MSDRQSTPSAPIRHAFRPIRSPDLPRWSTARTAPAFATSRYSRYNSQAANELSCLYRAEGEYRLNGGRLEMRLRRETHWDALIGGEPTVERHFGRWADAGTVRIEGDTMIRTYITCRNEAPAETIVHYHRSGEG